MSEEPGGTNGRPEDVAPQPVGDEWLSTLHDAEREVIELATTVDVSGMDERNREVLAHLAAMYEDSFREIVEKNRGYGFAFMATGNEIAARNGGQFDDPARATANGLYHRTGDKRSRFYQLMFTDTHTPDGDPVSETARENANYWMFMALVARHPELIEHTMSL